MAEKRVLGLLPMCKRLWDNEERGRLIIFYYDTKKNVSVKLFNI
jgi:hypothetical protein